MFIKASERVLNWQDLQHFWGALLVEEVTKQGVPSRLQSSLSMNPAAVPWMHVPLPFLFGWPSRKHQHLLNSLVGSCRLCASDL